MLTTGCIPSTKARTNEDENVPESTDLYVVDVNADEWNWIQLTHMNFVNTVIDDPDIENACNRLSDWLQDKPKLDKETGAINVQDDEIEFVVLTGFFL